MYFFIFILEINTSISHCFFLSSPTSLSQAVFPCGWPVPGRPPAQGVCPLPATQWTTTEPAVTFLAAEQSHLWQKQSSQHFPSHHSLPVFHGEFTTHAMNGLKERFMYDTDTATIPKSASKVWPISDQYLTNGSSLPWHELYTSRFKVQSKSTSHRNNSVLQFFFFFSWHFYMEK